MGLLPQMQAFEHRLFEIKDCDTIFVTVLFAIRCKTVFDSE
ncbi:hypothetical protein CUZ88_2672 [Enterococcus xinjiangensis]|nr:hypothetical protein [Enterococcus lactis]MBL4993183.1 hypothetical protein [Enterococcus lactis]